MRLDPIATEVVTGEGIETSASAGRLLGLPAWAAISAGNLARGLVLPPEVRAVVIATDRDQSGERAASEAWHRWCSEGRSVRLLWPHAVGADCNDVLTAPEVAS
ncbi:MAG: toprim domain-containing protein [Alphaproteobacteria bacterium]|nr:toprim domain-containing protein [Alphaproteobacteria bacterium]